MVTRLTNLRARCQTTHLLPISRQLDNRQTMGSEQQSHHGKTIDARPMDTTSTVLVMTW